MAVSAGLIVALALAGTAFAELTLRAKPFEFVGTAAQCGTAGTDTVTAEWVSGQGLPDSGSSNQALLLQKQGPTSNCAAAGAEIEGEEGITLTEIGFDYKVGGHCGGGAPRFNVTTTTSAGPIFLSCNGGTQIPVPGQPGWMRVRFMPPPTGTVQSILIIFDEGSDTASGGTIGTAGTILIDNITINGVVIGKPGNAR